MQRSADTVLDLLGKRLDRRVLSFIPMDDVICDHAPTDEKDDASTDNFYEYLERT